MSNDPVLLLHGQPGAAAEWEPVSASIGDGLQTIAFDRPGWDRRSAVRDLGRERERGARGPGSGRRRAGDGGRTQPRGGDRGVARLVQSRARGPVGADRAGGQRRVAQRRRLPAWLPRSLGWLASIGAMAGGGLVLAAGPARRWVAEVTALDDRYLRAAGRTLLSPYTWRSFVARAAAAGSRPPGARAPAGSDLGADDGLRGHRRQRRADRGGAAARAARFRGAELVEVEHAGHLLHQHHAGEVARVIAGA